MKSSYYLRGCKFTVMVDHRPLVGLSKKCWDQLTVRQARLFEKVQGYLYEVRYLEGKFMYLADFLSRSPVWRGSEEQKLREIMKTDIFPVKRGRLLCPLVDDGRFESLLTAAKNDNNYQLLIQALEEGRTDRQQLLGAYSKNVQYKSMVS